MEQYLSFVGGKPLAQIVSPPASGPTQKEKDALVATLTAQKDTFPSMIPHSPLSIFPLTPHHIFTHTLFVFSFVLFAFPFPHSQQVDQVPDVPKDLR